MTGQVHSTRDIGDVTHAVARQSTNAAGIIVSSSR